MKEKIEKWATSIVAIIIAFICFWPLGIGLIAYRLIKTYGKYIGISKILLYVGIGLVLFGLTGFIVFISEQDYSTAFLFPGLFIILPGFILSYMGNKRKNKIKSFNKYINYINSRKKISIDGLCNNVNENYDTVLNAITEMINLKIIDAYIDNDEVILKNTSLEKQNTSIFEETYNLKEKQNTKIVKCKECGAKNTIEVGKNTECEYCGTLLS